MNKKVALSVLSATVFASMAASAFAAPKSGLYIGGNVDKYYSMDTLFKMNSATSDQFSNELVAAGFSNLIYVDFDGKGASISEIMAAPDFEKAKQDLKADKFEGVYANIGIDGTANGTYDPRPDSLDGTSGDLKVDSVSAINGKTLEVKFGTAVKGSTVVTAGKLNTTNITFATVSGEAVDAATAAAELSEDGKTLTITADAAEYFKGDYVVTVKNTVTDEAGNAFESYSKVVTVKDTTRPVLTNVKYVDNKTVRINFSEPLKDDGTVSYVLADATSVIANNFVDDTGLNYIELDLSGLKAADTNKDIAVTIIGAKDDSGNLVSPNPLKTTVKLSTADVTAPTVASIVPTSNKAFTIKFSEELASLTIDAVDGKVATAVKDATDPTKYNVTLAGATAGLQTVTVSAFKDKGGNDGTPFSKVVNFDVDTVKPTVSSTKVEKIDGTEYLVITFNENVDPTAADGVTLTANYVKDFVSKSDTITIAATGATTDNFTLYKPVSGKSSSVKLALTDLEEAATYTVNLPLGLVTDLSGNQSEAKNAVSFDRGSNVVSGKPEIKVAEDTNGIKVVDTNTVEVYFKSKVDGASATNKANYSIEGATIEKAELTANASATGAVVKLTLVKDSNTFSGERTVNVSGVKSEGQVAMDAYSTTESLNENVRPTVASATLTGNDTITLTFSEVVTKATVEDATVDFDVFVGGVKVTPALTEAMVGGADGKELTLKLAGGATFSSSDLNKGIVVKPATDFEVKDVNGNVANFTSADVQ